MAPGGHREESRSLRGLCRDRLCGLSERRLVEQPRVLSGARPDFPSLDLFCELREGYQVAADIFSGGHHFSVIGAEPWLARQSPQLLTVVPPLTGSPHSPGVKEERQVDGK